MRKVSAVVDVCVCVSVTRFRFYGVLQIWSTLNTLITMIFFDGRALDSFNASQTGTWPCARCYSSLTLSDVPQHLWRTGTRGRDHRISLGTIIYTDLQRLRWLANQALFLRRWEWIWYCILESMLLITVDLRCLKPLDSSSSSQSRSIYPLKADRLW